MNDAELKKLLGAIGHEIGEKLSKAQGVLSAPGAVPPESANHWSAWQLRFAVIGGAIGILTGLYFVLSLVVTSSIERSLNAALKQPGADLATLTEQGRGLRRDVDRLLDRSAKNILQPSLSGPLARDAAGQIKDAAEWAVQRKIEIDPAAIQKVSGPLFKNPDRGTWEATIALANLRSFVNTTLTQAKQRVIATLTSPQREGPPFPAFPTPKPDEWVELVGGTVALDGKPGERGSIHNAAGVPYSPFRNLIVKNAMVTYHGGRVTLINVFFENCTFEITDNNNGRRMAEAILDPTPYTSFAGN